MSTSLNLRRLVLMVVLAAGFGSRAFCPGEATARVPAGRFDSVSQGCGQIQDQYDRAVRDLEKAAKTGTQAEYDAAFAHLVSIIRQWNGSPCSKYFGSLVYRKAPMVDDSVRGGTGGTPTLAPAAAFRSGSSASRGTARGSAPPNRARSRPII